MRDASTKRSCAAFNETGRKEGLRCLTGDRVPRQLPCARLPRVIREVDEWMAVIADAVFGPAFENRSDLPLLADSPGFGMFDAVRYHNSAQNEHELNCEAHVDAGLLSLSVFSSAAGLQMLSGDQTTWIDVPLHLGVVWAGSSATLASGGRFQPGYHRVAKCDAPRLTVWSEVCCRAQAERALLGAAPPAAAGAVYTEVVVRVKNLLGRVWETTVTVAADAYCKCGRGAR